MSLCLRKYSAVTIKAKSRELSTEQIPEVGVEPTPSCEDRILSPARLPFRHFGLPMSLPATSVCVKPGDETMPGPPPHDEPGIGFTSSPVPALPPACQSKLKNASMFSR